MNPLSLLTKGRTIRGLKERPGAYKLLEKSILPNFSGTKGAAPTTSHQGPFLKEEGRKKKEERRECAQPAAPEQPQPEPSPLEDLSVARLGAAVPAAGSGGANAPVRAPVATPVEPAAGTVAPQDRPRWSRLAGWARQWRPGRKEQPFQTPAVQTELALDKVKPVRNDLSEDDLEVVTIEKKAAKKAEKQAPREEAERERATVTT